MATGKQLLHGIAEASERLGINGQTLRKLVKAGQVRSVRLRRRVLIPATEIDRLANEGSGNPTTREQP
jgi:excisionase family DNA binding protein